MEDLMSMAKCIGEMWPALSAGLLAGMGVFWLFVRYVTKTAINTYASKQLELTKAQLQQGLEEYKTSLRKTEIFFEKRYDAAAELQRMYRSLIPSLYGENRDWSEVIDYVAHDLVRVKEMLDKYLEQFAPVLLDDEIDQIENCVATAREYAPAGKNPEPAREVRQATEDIMGSVKGVCDTQKRWLWAQLAP